MDNKIYAEAIQEVVQSKFEIEEHQENRLSSQAVHNQISNSKLWRSIRLAFRILILLVLVGLLAFIVAIIIIHPGCGKEPELEWWQKATMYRVDLNKLVKQPGLSTFKTLLNNIDYFKSRNVHVLWLSDIVDLNVDLKTLNKNYGTMNELKELIEKYKENDIKMFIDFIPNHTTTESEWFKKSLAGDLDYKDYYVWIESDKLPNNWQSASNQGPAWSLGTANRYYLHQFKATEPDLNYRNPRVFDELTNSIEFWLNLGIDGINVVKASYIYEDYLLRNEEIINSNQQVSYDNLKHALTRDQRETFNLLAELKAQISKNTDKVLIVELDAQTSVANRAKYFGNRHISGADLIIYERLFESTPVNGRNFINQIESITQEYKKYDHLPVWVLDENTMRDANPIEYRLLQASLSLLPGTIVLKVDNTLASDDSSLIEAVSELKKTQKTFQFGDFKYEIKPDACSFVQFQRFFDGQNSYSIHFDLDSRNCSTLKYELASKLIKNATPDVQLINIDFVDGNEEASIKELNKLESVSFNSNGKTKVKLPRNSFLVLTWKFIPLDIKDIL